MKSQAGSLNILLFNDKNLKMINYIVDVLMISSNFIVFIY